MTSDEIIEQLEKEELDSDMAMNRAIRISCGAMGNALTSAMESKLNMADFVERLKSRKRREIK